MTETNDSETGRSGTLKIVAVAVVVLLLGGGGAFWFLVLRDTAPPPATVSALDADAAARGSGSAPSTPEGTWVATKSENGFAGYRILELFAGDTIKKQAAGRTGDIEGSLTVSGATVESADVTVNLATLKSDQVRRDDTLIDRGLQTKLFPEAKFNLTEPIKLANVPKQGEEIKANAKGELTLHGQTRPVVVDLTAKWNGSTISVNGSTPIQLADYGIEAISISGVVTVDDQGTLEFQILFAKA